MNPPCFSVIEKDENDFSSVSAVQLVSASLMAKYIVVSVCSKYLEMVSSLHKRGKTNLKNSHRPLIQRPSFSEQSSLPHQRALRCLLHKQTSGNSLGYQIAVLSSERSKFKYCFPDVSVLCMPNVTIITHFYSILPQKGHKIGINLQYY